MGKQIQFKRLSKADYEGLVLAHDKCARAIGLLQRTAWNGAPGCSSLIEDVDRFLCQLYNRAEASLRKTLGLPPIETPPDAPEEIPAADELGQVDPAKPGEGESEQ